MFFVRIRAVGLPVALDRDQANFEWEVLQQQIEKSTR